MKNKKVLYLVFFLSLLASSCKRETNDITPQKDLEILSKFINSPELIDSCSFEYYSRGKSDSRLPGSSDMALLAVLYYSDSAYINMEKLLTQYRIKESKGKTNFIYPKYKYFREHEIRSWLPLDIQQKLMQDSLTLFRSTLFAIDTNSVAKGVCVPCSKNRMVVTIYF